MLSDFQMSLSSLFHSLIDDGKYLFWKMLCFVPNKGMLCDLRVGRDVFFFGIKKNKKKKKNKKNKKIRGGLVSNNFV